MKKALIVLLILAIAGGLFAQDEGLTWTGAVKTGLKIVADDGHNGEDIGVNLYSDDAEVPIRLQLNGAYTKDNYGVVFGLRFDPYGLWTYVNPTADKVEGKLWGAAYNAYAWASFVNDIIKVSAGRIDDGVWKTGGVENWGISGDGLRVEIAPITGLNLGLMLRAPVTTLTIKQFLSETAFGAKYESDLFWVAAGIILDGQADGLTGVNDDYLANVALDYLTGVGTLAADAPDSDHGLDFRAGVGVKPLSFLEVSAEARAFNASKFADYGYFVLDEHVAAKLLSDKLTVGLKAWQYFFGSDWGKLVPTPAKALGDSDADEALKPYLKLLPYVTYNVSDALEVGLEAGLGLWKDVYDLKFNLKPKVTYKIGTGAKIVAFYNFASENFYEDVEVNGRKSDKSNTVQVDFVWEV
jgi:hypothetical protein